MNGHCISPMDENVKKEKTKHLLDIETLLPSSRPSSRPSSYPSNVFSTFQVPLRHTFGLLVNYELSALHRLETWKNFELLLNKEAVGESSNLTRCESSYYGLWDLEIFRALP